MKDLSVIYKSVDEITPYDKNPRKHSDFDVDITAKSIKKYGWKQPIVIDKKGVIISGHGRYMAACKLGLNKVPVVIADDLTAKQVRELRTIDNQTSENSTWDKENLYFELQELSLDGFEPTDWGFDELVDPEEEHQENKEEYRDTVSDILNLNKGDYTGWKSTGKYDIPIIEPVKELPEIKEWISFNYVLSDKDPEGKGVHFFIDDYQFERVWNDPDKYVDKLSRYACVVAPDFSPYGDMPLALQIYNHYRKHWCAAYWQEHGVTVIPCIRASTDPRSLEWYLEGEPRGGIVCISSMWTSNSEMTRDYFVNEEYKKMHDTLKPKKVFIYGREVEGIKGNIEYIQSYTDKHWDRGK